MTDDAHQLSVAPHQHLLNLNPLLGKPGGGSRTVCKTPVLYRMECRADEEVEVWERENKTVYDSAAERSSAFLSACLRNLKAEVASMLGISICCLYNDFHNLFGSLDLVTLIDKARQANFPLESLVRILAQHTAPKVIQLKDTLSSQGVSVSRYILAGCKFAIALTRVYLMRDYKALIARHTAIDISAHVDDTPMYTQGNSSDAKMALLQCASDFHKRMRKLKLSLSGKAGIVASNAIEGIKLAKSLAKVGVEATPSLEYRDLAVSFTAGRSRPSFRLRNLREFVLTHVILTTGACGREALSST